MIDSNQVDGSFNKEPNHEWNVIEISGKFYFIDCNLGSGFIDEKDEFNFNLNPLYFLTPAEFYIDDHFPIKSEWQLLDKEISKITFEKKNFYKIIDNYNEIFKRNIHLINETLPVIFYDGNENINNYNEINLKFSCPKRDIYAFLKFKSCKNFNNNCTIFSKTNWEKSKNNNFNNFNTGANYSSYNKKNNEITDINFERLVFLEKKLMKPRMFVISSSSVLYLTIVSKAKFEKLVIFDIVEFFPCNLFIFVALNGVESFILLILIMTSEKQKYRTISCV